jgi:hypothetical protein
MNNTTSAFDEENCGVAYGFLIGGTTVSVLSFIAILVYSLFDTLYDALIG